MKNNIEVIKASKELTPLEIYMLTANPSIVVMKDVPTDTMIEVKAFAFFNDTKETGEIVELLSIMDKDGTCYSTQSATFKDSFNYICEVVGKTAGFTIKKLDGQTKAGRPYVNCGLISA